MEPESPESYGFVNPSDVLRGVHIIPAFNIGKIPSELTDDREDWEYFYISMYLSFYISSKAHN